MEVEQNLKDVIREGNKQASEKGLAVGIAWVLDAGEWRVYDLTQGTPENYQPELVCFGLGVMPLAITPVAMEGLICAIKEVIPGYDHTADLAKEQACLLKKHI